LIIFSRGGISFTRFPLPRPSPLFPDKTFLVLCRRTHDHCTTPSGSMDSSFPLALPVPPFGHHLLPTTLRIDFCLSRLFDFSLSPPGLLRTSSSICGGLGRRAFPPALRSIDLFFIRLVFPPLLPLFVFFLACDLPFSWANTVRTSTLDVCRLNSFQVSHHSCDLPLRTHPPPPFFHVWLIRPSFHLEGLPFQAWVFVARSGLTLPSAGGLLFFPPVFLGLTPSARKKCFTLERLAIFKYVFFFQVSVFSNPPPPLFFLEFSSRNNFSRTSLFPTLLMVPRSPISPPF